MRYFIIAGEASGDLHAAKLIAEIVALDPNAVFQGWGGDLMHNAGCEILKHYRSLAFMGFIEVVKHINVIVENFKICKAQIQAFEPDTVILVDYPGFNLRLCKWLKTKGYRVVYYIAPQVWAWKENRVSKIQKYVDLLLVILPFEKAFFAKHGVNATYVGHPLLDQNRSAFLLPNAMHKPLLALLPGSRKQEISTILPIMLRALSGFTAYNVLVACAPSVPLSLYEHIIKNFNVTLVEGKTQAILQQAHAAVVTSGTATLETAIAGTPMVVVYKGSNLSYEIGKRLVKVKYISLVNLILDRALVPELIQHACNEENIALQLNALLSLNSQAYQTQKSGFEELKVLLGNRGASKRAAEAILEMR